MKKSTFPTPQDAEAAFYEALETGDLETMMEVWAEDEEIVCVHPGGPRLAGYDQVLVPELNLGQLVRLLRAEFLVPAEGLSKVQGQPFQVAEIQARIASMLRGKD